jgi:hypothetical protein
MISCQQVGREGQTDIPVFTTALPVNIRKRVVEDLNGKLKILIATKYVALHMHDEGDGFVYNLVIDSYPSTVSFFSSPSCSASIFLPLR